MLMLFLRNVRTSLIVAITIPISIIATFSIMDLADVSLNIISLSGLSLAVGLVVDNAVVVLENIFNFKEEGEDGKSSSIKRSEEHTSELQSRGQLVCRLLLEKKK